MTKLEGFNDLIEEVKAQGDLIWITQKKPNHEANKDKNPELLKQAVLDSARLDHAIQMIIDQQSNGQILSKNEYQRKKDTIKQEARLILDEMAQNFNLKYVRFLGYILIKVFKRVYQHIYYNSNIYSRLNEAFKTNNILYLPTHRSYMDFILVSLICFHTDCPMPVIAAAQDFLGLNIVAKFLRHSGAFFIRRSFGNDQLYWALFNEYVQLHLKNKQHTVEFFIEGTRSRTNKSLLPKQGMLSTCLEPLLNNRLNDLLIVPISITYERLLEENLYARELLGIPKPKENVNGLVKARQILNENYGSIIVNFGDFISLRGLVRQSTELNRLSHTLQPAHIFSLDKTEIKFINTLSYDLSHLLIKKQFIQPSSLVFTSILLLKEPLFKELVDYVSLFKSILINLGYQIYWPIDFTQKLNDYERMKALVIQNLQQKMDILTLSTQELHDSTRISLKLGNNLFDNASNYFLLCSFRNQLINMLVKISLVTICLEQSNQINDLYKNFKFLVQLFRSEFIFHSNEIELDRFFNETLVFLKSLNICNIDDNQTYKILNYNLNHLNLFNSLIQPYLFNYLTIYKIIYELKQFEFKDEKLFSINIQKYCFNNLFNESCANLKHDYEVLSLNVIANALASLREFGLLIKNKEPNGQKFQIKINDFNSFLAYLNSLVLKFQSCHQSKL